MSADLLYPLPSALTWHLLILSRLPLYSLRPPRELIPYKLWRAIKDGGHTHTYTGTIDVHLTCRRVTRRAPNLKSMLRTYKLFSAHTTSHSASPWLFELHNLLSLLIMTRFFYNTAYQSNYGTYTYVFSVPEVTAEGAGCCYLSNRCEGTWHTVAASSKQPIDAKSVPKCNECVLCEDVCIRWCWYVDFQSKLELHRLVNY